MNTNDNPRSKLPEGEPDSSQEIKALLKASIFVAVENPLVIKKYASATLRKGKTDKLDAIKLAQYGIEKWLILKQYEKNEEIFEELKLLGRQYTNYIEMRVASLNRLHGLIDQTAPGIEPLLKSHCTNKAKNKLLLYQFLFSNGICNILEDTNARKLQLLDIPQVFLMLDDGNSQMYIRIRVIIVLIHLPDTM